MTFKQNFRFQKRKPWTEKIGEKIGCQKKFIFFEIERKTLFLLFRFYRNNSSFGKHLKPRLATHTVFSTFFAMKNFFRNFAMLPKHFCMI